MAEQTNAARQRHVLVVDDNVELAQTHQQLLEIHGYKVTLAHDGVQALKLIAQTDIEAVLCDLSMPQLEGDMFYNAVAHVRPELTKRFVFVTGHAGNPKYEGFLQRTGVRVLYKPVPMKELIGTLEALFESPAA